jgi:hypothetical protein
MIKGLWLVFSILLVSAISASAQVPCRARTCTQALHACTGLRCMQVAHDRQHKRGKCADFCSSRYDECLKTGEFRGKVCHDMGLLRQ